MPYKTLPSNPSLDHLKHQARDLQKALGAHQLQAFQRVREFHPRFKDLSDSEIQSAKLSLSDVQLVIAREYCQPSWAKLKSTVSSGPTEADNAPYHERIKDSVFRTAVDLLDAGDEIGLRSYLVKHSAVAKQRVFFSMSDYFGQPTLLEFVAENPIRHRTLPPNAVAVAKVVLEAGAKEDVGAVNRALGLTASGLVARECGVQIGLIDLFCDYGGDAGKAVGAALAHGEFAAVEALIRRGAPMDLPTASATGRIEEAEERLPSASPADRHKALALASQFGRTEIVRILLKAGEDPNRYNPAGCHSHSTPLHQAALAGHVEVVKLLVESGADLTIKDILFGGTALGWAEHGGRTQVAEVLRGASSAVHPPS